MNMNLAQILKRELDVFKAKHQLETLDILETGCIRFADEQYHPNDGWSTVAFAEYVCEFEGTFHSVDLDTKAAREVLTGRALNTYVRFHEGHSIDVLTGMVANAYANAKKNSRSQVMLGGVGFIDVAFLDSQNNSDLILHEFLVVSRMMRSPGLVIVDDVDLESQEVVKGHGIIPWLDSRGTQYAIQKRHGDDYSTGVLVFEV